MALEKQMELFDEGGLLDEGGTKDPVSGNDVPVGSLQEEVRDDVPAMLSEGEFVMPADVVRYHGLDKMMALRDEAKMGLQRMEAMGQMGNAEEATLPDDVPFGLEDLDIAEEPREMQVGGFIPATPMFTPGGVQQSQFANYTPQYNPYQMPQYTTPDYSGYQAPQQTVVPMGPTTVPTFTQFVRPQTATYVNADGNEIQIPVGQDGTPLIPVPPGYTLKADTPATPDPTPDPAQQQQQQVGAEQTEEDPSYVSPEEQARQEQRSKEIKARKEAAKKLGYTKEANPLEGLLGALIPGASLFGVGGNQEAGTIMPDGTIADGQGNTFDPISGAQMGGKGFLGLGKSEAEKFGLSDQIPESSLAGLRSEAGEQSIKDLIASIPPTEDKPTDVGVETARVTEEGTAADIAAAQAAAGQARESFPTRTDSARDRRNDLVAQTYEALVAGNVPEDLALTAAKQAVDEGTVNAEVASLFGDIGSALTDASLAGRSLAGADKAVPSGVAAAIRSSQQPRAITTTQKPRVDTQVVQDEMSRLQDTYEREAFGTTRKTTAIQNKINEAKSKDPSQYARDVRAGKYDNDFAALDTAREERNLQRNTGKNKAGTDIRGQYGDDVAKKVRDDQGTVGSVNTETGQISYDSSHDWSKPTQTNVNSVTSTKAQETSDSRDDAKIVCTEMYRQTQLADWKEAIKIWGVYEKKYLTPYHEKGYHWLFMPWVKGMRSSNTLTSVGAYLAKARTQHLKHVMTRGKAPDNTIGNVWCKIVHPLTYLTGRMLSWQKK